MLERNNFRILLIIIYWAETYWLQKNKEEQLVVTETTGHEVNAEKFEEMIITCVENVEELHNIKVSNTSVCEGITQKKSKLLSQIN